MTKFFTIFLIIALFLAGFLTYHFSKDTSNLVPVQESPKDVKLELYEFHNWHEFSSNNGTFTVLLPTLPQNATENITDKNTGENRKYDMYVSEKEDGTIFMISLITFEDPIPKDQKDKLMRTMMNDMMESTPNNELRSVESGSYKGHESLDYSFGNTEMNVDAKSFIVDDTLYVLTRIVKAQNYNPDEYNFFINSFDLSSENQKSE